MMQPITRCWCFMVVAIVAVNVNHDFIEGSYAGPHWFMPIDFFLTQAVWLFVAIRLAVSQIHIEEESE